MSQPTASINTKLIDSLAQIILSLTDEERQLLAQKIQHSSLSEEEHQHKKEALQRDITLGVEQLKNGDYTEYNDSSLPNLFENIKRRAKQRLEQEPAQ
ncbi:hypothetical protein H6G17_31940 [Chroococcidiopsis sp. FACHB-1243]|uniref:hypothetical protein n=1 Tax=Chroococcidiopsis sp. [FACHB-1243] TaxID=2692781 RepID=UPI0017830D0E|nr:hypothetical protein [Chroococcidiopsis sp. [FACHB-1243]]MBD2310011.1 hypothetical protein [Chroococcidiopsis sp. [FACHB-1243]]